MTLILQMYADFNVLFSHWKCLDSKRSDCKTDRADDGYDYGYDNDYDDGYDYDYDNDYDDGYDYDYDNGCDYDDGYDNDDPTKYLYTVRK